MGRIKRLEAFLNQGAQRTRSEEQSIVNGKQTWRLIVSGTMRNYTRAVGLWRAYQKLNPGVRINNFETPKAFVLMLAKAIDDQEGEPVDPKIIESTTNVSPFATVPIQTGDSAIFSSYMTISGSSGICRATNAQGTQTTVLICGAAACSTSSPLFESTPREGSGRGLRYKDLWFVVLRNEPGSPEFAMEVKKDGKGMTSIPWRKPPSSHVEPYALARCHSLSNGRILGLLVPPEEGIVRIHWRPDFLERPVYERGDGHIWSAHAYSARLHDAGVRARFPSLINYDFCAEGLSTIDKEYTSSQRRRHAGHESDSVYDQYYAPTNPRTDGQAVYAGNAPRTLPSRLLRLLKMDHNPESLPDSEDATIKKERAEILGRLRGLKLAALKQYREKQKNHPQQLAETAKGKDVGHRRILFSRISHLIRVRQRLSKSLFIVATIRGGAGRAVLKNLIELHRSEFEFEARPGLELENCDCAVAKMYASSLTSRSDVNPSVASQRAYNGSTSTAVTCRILHPRAHVVPPPLSLSSASCAPQAIGLRASTTGSATARAI
ncbi:hypothetical protein FRB97_005060 [Tulasnella sp. 331]|nr:hypothetical protein FRB97_005060 [Tulasnella sp. 331]